MPPATCMVLFDSSSNFLMDTELANELNPIISGQILRNKPYYCLSYARMPNIKDFYKLTVLPPKCQKEEIIYFLTKYILIRCLLSSQPIFLNTNDHDKTFLKFCLAVLIMFIQKLTEIELIFFVI